ncbi:polyprenyl synthetase family protein [Limnohabitans sp. Rim11]|uniref:polyprenyl synthetase family protein n=1 Tax=Limnohabitans sp. Rim11 TaxID=1100719 RepID=UPI000A9F3668|nr:farnesyl diphosphate synthase [Limnohabitans sp. Rim11]
MTAQFSNAFDFKDWSDERLAQVEQALKHGIDAHAPAQLGEAMRYAVLDGGKRLRPLLVLAAAQAVGVDLDAATVSDQASSLAALKAACAVELIHAYSLVHDDMPCMDNDVLRRGKPTVHVKYGEAQALLAGDALQALAFEYLTPQDGSTELSVQAIQVGLLARASGYEGMAGGQAIDLASVGLPLTEAQLRQMHKLKTGALLLCSVQLGAVCAGKPSSTVFEAFTKYAEALGLAFQVVDDILDVTSDSATLGKTAGKDAAADKPTYVSLLGLEQAQQLAEKLYADSLAALDASGLNTTATAALRALASLVVQRKN